MTCCGCASATTGRGPQARRAPPEQAAAGPGAGHGLLGMRERAAAAGGSLRTGAGPGGGFCVEAELPARASES